MTSLRDEEAAHAIARRMIAFGEGVPADADGERIRAIAWALKTVGDAAWSSDPASLAGVADTALRLDAIRGLSTSAQLESEVLAIRDWIVGIADLAQGHMEEALSRFDGARDGLLRAGLDGLAVRTGVPKIMALSLLGRHSEAAEFGEFTQRALRASGDVHTAGKVSLNLGNLRCRCNDYAGARVHYREAAALFARVGDRERSVMADIGLADASAATGDLDEALRVYARAQMRARQHGLPVLDAMVEESTALVAMSRGDYAQALAGLEQARRRYEGLSMRQHVATAEKQLADAYLELRLLPEALALLDCALEHFEALQMPVERAWALTQKGRTLAMLDPASTGARDALNEAAALFESRRVAGGMAEVHLARAELANALGDARTALGASSEAARVFADAGMAEGGVRASLAAATGRLLAGEGATAAAAFDRAGAMARSLGLLALEVRSLSGLGLAKLAVGDERAAREAFESAIAGFEEQRRALPGDDLRDAFLADHLRPYQELLRLALLDQRREPGSDRASLALTALERFRARVFSDRLDAPRSEQEPDDLIAEQQRARLQWLYRRIHRGDVGEESDPRDVEEAHRIERDLLERQRRLRFVDTPSNDAGERTDVFELAALQRALRPGEALVEYDVDAGELFAFVVTHDRVDLIEHLAAWPTVLAALRSMRFQIESLRHGSAPVERHLTMLAERMRIRMAQLHALVWAPVASFVDGATRILVVPHEELGSLPFAALHDGTDFLCRRVMFSMMPSAHIAIRALSRRVVEAKTALVVGESTSLAHVAAEAAFVASLFEHSLTLTGAEATLERVCANVGEADVLHLACHARFRQDNPKFSALHLVDGALTVHAVESMSLRAGTVVLSACETGLAEYAHGEEVAGLVRAFLLAGASRIVASLWTVDDAITARFMQVFYSGLRARTSPSQALQAAQTAIMRDHPHPVHWAAFVLHGGW